MTKKVLSFILLFVSTLAFSQAGSGVYQFLNLPVSSRLMALGGTNISLRDNDVNFALQNPALLSANTHNTLGLSYANYYADIQFGTASYGRTIGKDNYFAFGMQYIDYGTFKATSETNDPDINLGTFTAKDFAAYVAYARPLSKHFTVGGTFKPIYSAYERYTSFGVAMDAGLSYVDSTGLFSAGLVLKNIGTQLKGYYSDENGQHYESLPFNIELGFSKKFTHAPIRLSLTLQNLQHWDLSYQSTNQKENLLSTSDSEEKISFLDMAFRHAIIAAELVPSKNLYLTVSYNHRRQKEMAMPGFKSGAGFAFGFGAKISKFQVGFGMSKLQTGTSSVMLTVNTSLNDFKL